MSTSTIAMTEIKERHLPKGFTMAGLTFVLAALSWLGPFSIDTYLPSLPSISQSLNVSPAQVQQTMTSFLAFFAIMSLWHGAISDAFGRRRLTLICLGIFAAASLGCATAVNVHSLLFFRALQGATAGAGMVVGRLLCAIFLKELPHSVSCRTSRPFLRLRPLSLRSREDISRPGLDGDPSSSFLFSCRRSFYSRPGDSCPRRCRWSSGIDWKQNIWRALTGAC
jgi:hypothetical protein